MKRQSVSQPALKVAIGILLVKDRIQQFYAQTAALERSLNDFKKKHSYCCGRPFCMNIVKNNETTCVECRKANANPKYKKQRSQYGEMRMKERAAERAAKNKSSKKSHSSKIKKTAA